MDVYLIRHAHAGSRGPDNRDKWRTLSDKGHQRAGVLADLLADIEVAAVVSSPATRCVQTVEPLAARLGLLVEEDDTFWEDGSLDDALDAVLARAADGVVICSHGNIIPALIDWLARQGMPVTGRGCEKGSVWVLSHDGAEFTGARYISKVEEALT